MTCTQLGCTYPERAFHCGKGGCHRTFMYLNEFDMHRQGAVDHRYCDDPAAYGLVHEDDMWSTADHHLARRRMNARLAAGRARKAASEQA